MLFLTNNIHNWIVAKIPFVDDCLNIFRRTKGQFITCVIRTSRIAHRAKRKYRCRRNEILLWATKEKNVLEIEKICCDRNIELYTNIRRYNILMKYWCNTTYATYAVFATRCIVLITLCKLFAGTNNFILWYWRIRKLQ